MNVGHRQMRVGISVCCLVTMLVGQMAFLPWQANATGEVGRPPLPPGIVRLPFHGVKDVFNVPGCWDHNRNNINYEKGYNTTRSSKEMNDRAFDFGLYFEDVLAAGDGTILPIEPGMIVIDHGNGVRSYYVHISGTDLSEGDHVHAGDVIATSGDYGVPGVAHLHFAVTTGGDPAVSGVAANINDLPGIAWDLNVLNDDGYVTNCDLPVNEKANGDAPAHTEHPAVVQEPENVDEPSTSDDGLITAVSYNPAAAVDVAFGALHEDNEYGDDSANFVSKALWGGGLPRTAEWDAVLGSPHDFATFLINSYDVGDGRYVQPGTISQIDWSDNTAGGAALGDVIAYDYEGDGRIDHVAFVTNLNEQNYPSVCEHSPYAENRYWSYSDEDDAWIEHARPGSVAYLIHIDPITSGGF